MVALEFGFRGGASQDPAGKAGALTMLAGLLDEGAGDLDDQAFQQRARRESDRDRLPRRARQSQRTDADAGAPSRPRRRTAARSRSTRRASTRRRSTRVREQLQAHIRHETNEPGAVAGRGLRARVFPGHPYSRPTNGTAESLAAVERDDMPALAKRLITRARLGDRRRRRDRRSARGTAASTTSSPICRRSTAASRRSRRRSSAWAGSRSSTSTCRRRRSASAGRRRARRRRLHGLRRARPYPGRRHRPFLAPVPRSAREARPRLYRLCGLSPLDHASYPHRRHDDQERARARIARRDPRRDPRHGARTP